MASNFESDNAYEILGVPRKADVPTIRKAFKKLAIKYHPDARPAQEKEYAAKVFAKINLAHEMLRDPDKRAKYDAALDRGITPELDKDVDDAMAFHSLADIVGEIASLKIPADQNKILSPLDTTLRNQLLVPNLIRSENIRENVIALMPFGSIILHKHYSLPPGKLTQGFLAVTELRIIVLMMFVHTWESDDTKYTETYWRTISFVYGGIKNLSIREAGRISQSYSITLEDEDGTLFHLSINESNLTRLFLVVNKYQLPLKIESSADQGSEYVEAVLVSTIPLILYAIPYIIAPICVLCADRDDFAETWAGLYNGLTNLYLTSLAIYLFLFLLSFLVVRVYCSWKSPLVEDIFGKLVFNFSDGAKEDLLQKTEPQKLKAQKPPDKSPEPSPLNTPPPVQPKTPPAPQASQPPASPRPQAKEQSAPASVAVPSSILGAASKDKPQEKPPTPPKPEQQKPATGGAAPVSMPSSLKPQVKQKPEQKPASIPRQEAPKKGPEKKDERPDAKMPPSTTAQQRPSPQPGPQQKPNKEAPQKYIISCPRCGGKMKVMKSSNKRGKCPHCGQPIEVSFPQ